jgi:hypothetical protein
MNENRTGIRDTKGGRILGAERSRLATDFMRRYVGGESIRSLATSTGWSYGFVHQVLTESGVQFRPRGGAWRRKSIRAAGAAELHRRCA